MNQHATGDMPTITASAYTTSSWSGVAQGADTNQFVMGHANYIQTDDGESDQIAKMAQLMRRSQQASPEKKQPALPMNQKRIVRVYLADTDENVPLDKSLLFTSDEKLTDLNDQELYFEIPIQEVLKKHNDLRRTIVNRKATERIGKEVFLDPVKIRDLKMTVVSIATF